MCLLILVITDISIYHQIQSFKNFETAFEYNIFKINANLLGLINHLKTHRNYYFFLMNWHTYCFLQLKGTVHPKFELNCFIVIVQSA